MSDKVAQEFQVISKGNANIEGPQANFQNEISDPDECVSSGHEEQHSRSFHDTSCRIACKSTCEEIGTSLSGNG